MYALLTLSDDSARDHCGDRSCRDRSTDLLTLAHCDDLLVFLLFGSREALIKSGAQEAQSDFSSDCMKTTPLG